MSQAGALKAARIVRDAGGRVVGRTRLQKIAYLLSASGLEDGFRFSYRHYGPFSDELAEATRDASLLGFLRETEQKASWGGSYSTYVSGSLPDTEAPVTALARRLLSEVCVHADSVELELAATAVYLAKEGFNDAWNETARRKPEKASDGRLDKARDLYRRLSEIETPTRLPTIA
jgi:uncharacterized protein YwgA